MTQELKAGPPMMTLPRAKKNSIVPDDRPITEDGIFRPILGPGRDLWENGTLSGYSPLSF